MYREAQNVRERWKSIIFDHIEGHFSLKTEMFPIHTARISCTFLSVTRFPTFVTSSMLLTASDREPRTGTAQAASACRKVVPETVTLSPNAEKTCVAIKIGSPTAPLAREIM